MPQTPIIKGEVTQSRPLVLFANVGDTIVFREMAGHDTETIPELIPAGASGWESKVGTESYSVTLDATGAYVYKCNPHVSSGMVGGIVASELPPANLQELTDSPLNKGMIARTLRKLNQALNTCLGGFPVKSRRRGRQHFCGRRFAAKFRHDSATNY